MKNISSNEYLRESLLLLVRLCGVDMVKTALKDVEAATAPEQQTEPRGTEPRRAELRGTERRATTPRGREPRGTEHRATIPRAISLLEETDRTKYDLLKSFFTCIDSGTILPEAEDIRRFVELLGIKQLPGKSRRDLIPKLANVLAELPLVRLEQLIAKAGDISENKRREGYSLLTDKLLENVKVAS